MSTTHLAEKNNHYVHIAVRGDYYRLKKVLGVCRGDIHRTAALQIYGARKELHDEVQKQ